MDMTFHLVWRQRSLPFTLVFFYATFLKTPTILRILLLFLDVGIYMHVIAILAGLLKCHIFLQFRPFGFLGVYCTASRASLIPCFG